MIQPFRNSGIFFIETHLLQAYVPPILCVISSSVKSSNEVVGEALKPENV